MEGLWEESKLKIAHQGDCLISAKDHSIAAYKASVIGTWNLVAQFIGIREEMDSEGPEKAGLERMEL